jgi:GT2 family glycosyltransferase
MPTAEHQLDDQPIRASIVIVNYNGGDEILECLDSVFKHLEPGVEVILVDNLSADGSPEAIKTRFPNVLLIQAGENRGFGAGCNLGVSRARGKYVVFLNPDTIVREGWLGPLLEQLQRDGSVGLVTSRIVLADHPGTINTCGNTVHLTGLTLCRGLGAPSESFSRIEEVAAVSGAAFAMTKDLFTHLGGFDEEMFLYMEDTDLSLRAQLVGYKCRCVPDSIVLHDYALKMTPMKVFYQERNRYLMLLKTLRWPTLVVLAPAAFSAELITWAFVALKDRTNAGNKIRAYRWICSNWSSILRKRAIVQSLRTVRDRQIVRSWSIKLEFGQASTPALALLGHIAFDPLFALFKLMALTVVWW